MSAALGISVEKLLIPKIWLLSFFLVSGNIGGNVVGIQSTWKKQSHARNGLWVEQGGWISRWLEEKNARIYRRAPWALNSAQGDVQFCLRCETCVTVRM